MEILKILKNLVVESCSKRPLCLSWYCTNYHLSTLRRKLLCNFLLRYVHFFLVFYPHRPHPLPAYYNDEDFEFWRVRWLHTRGR
jgi:hypothetical protein